MPDFDSYSNDPRWQALHGYNPQASAQPYPWHAMSPIYGGGPEPRGPSFLGLDPNKSGMLGGLAQAFGPMIAETLRIPLGGHVFNFGSDQNVVSTEIARAYMTNLQAARTAGARADVPQLEDVFRGMARIIGHESTGTFREGPNRGKLQFSPDVEASISRMAQDVGPGMLPILASMFPDTIDRVMPRGSMTVAAQSFTRAGRYIRDPATGGTLSEDPEYGMRIAEGLMQRGLRSTAGLGAGRIGQTFEALFEQGLIGSGTDLQKMVQKGELTGGQAREIQTDRVKEQLGKYSHVIAAINDIFAESGDANAPMAKLVKGLQSLTQGGLGTYDPGQLNRIVRTAHAATQPGGIGMSMEQLGALTGTMGQMLQHYGVNPALAGPLAPYVGALGSEYAARGFTTPSPEGMSQTQFAMLQAQRIAAGAGSDAMNTAGAIWAQANALAAGSEDTPLAQIAAGLRRGEDVIKLKDGSVFDFKTAGPAQYQEVYAKSGQNYNTFLNQLRMPNANKSWVAREDKAVQALVPKLQDFESEWKFQSTVGPWLSTFAPGHEQDVLNEIRMVSLQDGIKSDSDVARIATANLRAKFEGMRDVGPEISTILGQRAQLMNTPSGFASYRATDPALHAAAAADMVKLREQAWRMAQLQHLGRGDLTRKLTTAMVDAGFSDEDMIAGHVASHLGARMAGLVTTNDVTGAIADWDKTPAGQLLKLSRQGPISDLAARALRDQVMSSYKVDVEKAKDADWLGGFSDPKSLRDSRLAKTPYLAEEGFEVGEHVD